MKKITLHTILLTLLLSVGIFTRCVSDNDIFPPDPILSDGDRAISLRLMDSESTRGMSEQIGNEEVQFNDGYLFFVNSGGTILYRFAIVYNPSVSVNGLPYRMVGSGNDIHRGDLSVGVMLPSVRGQVVRVVMVGNYNGTMPNVGANISAVRGRVLDIAGQHDAWNVNLFGESGLTPLNQANTVTGNRIYTANITLRPTVARFEIGNIRAGDRAGVVNTITSFRLEGIFIDFFYRNARIDGEITSANRTTGNQEPANFTNLAYAFDADNGLHDWFMPNGLVSDNLLTVTPRTYDDTFPTNYVWGYQVFARSYNQTCDAYPPRIILRLSEVATPCNNFGGTQFVTVRGFTLPNGASLEYIEAAFVYHISSIVFNQNDLSIIPNREDIAINVEIELAIWNERRIAQQTDFRQPNPQPVTIVAGSTHTFPLGEALGGVTCADPTITYRWERRNAAGVITPIPDSNVARLQTQPLFANTYFRRIAYRCNASIVSEWALVSVVSPLWQPLLESVHGICPGATIPFEVARYTNELGLEANGVTYFWQTSKNKWTWDNVTAPSTNPNFVIPMNTSLPIYFRRVAVWNGVHHYSNSAQITPPPINIPEWVAIGQRADGTPIRWATRNVDLSSPTGFTDHPRDWGMLFRWNRCYGFTASGANNSAFDGIHWDCTNNRVRPIIPTTPVTWLGGNIAGTTWYEHNDPCPEGWRVPNAEEIQILFDSGRTWIATFEQGAAAGFGCSREGTLFGVAPNQILVPAAGARHRTDGVRMQVTPDGSRGLTGFLWSSTRGTGQTAIRLRFDLLASNTNVQQMDMAAFNVRCVKVD